MSAASAARKGEEWPGSRPPTPREIEAANRRLLTALRRHRDVRQRLAQIERELREARARVRALLRLLATEEPGDAAGPRCAACQAPLGTNARCLECQAYGECVTPEEPA